MTNIFYPVRRTVVVGLGLLVVTMGTVAAIAVRSALHPPPERQAIVRRPPAPAPRRSVTVTVQVGERLSAFWARLERQGIVGRQSLEGISASVAFPQFPFVPAPERARNRFEGLFAPGSYRIELPAATDAPPFQDGLTIVRRLLAATAARIASYERQGLRVGYDKLILASIVQKEDVPGTDYGLVASVFLNRLRLGMRLASCPTLEYALGYHRPFLLDSDIAVRSPYNTYLKSGLPPTPICFFSDKALASVVSPVTSPYRFFVLNWVTRRIVFARTFAEQERNAQVARADYIAAHGVKSLHRKAEGVFYEPLWPAGSATTG